MRLYCSLVLCAFLAACGDDGGGDDFNRAPELDPSGTSYGYVISSVTVPTTQAEAREIGLDLDGDDNIDNGIGSIFATVGALSPESDPQASVDEAVTDGTNLMLATVKATSLADATGAGLFVHLGGNPSTAPCADDTDTVCGRHLDGATSFDIAADSPADSVVTGNIAAGRFVGGPGAVTVEVSVVDGAEPLVLNLVAARADVRVSEDGLMSGVIAGGISPEEIESKLLPTLDQLLDQVAAEDCTGSSPPCCLADSTGAQIYELFDTDMNCDITEAELAESSLVETIFSLDVDLFDEGGELNPNIDKVFDALSVGVAFTGVPAMFEMP